MPLRTTAELIGSLDDELVDLLGERMKLATFRRAARTAEEVEQYVQRMRSLAAVYRAPADLVEGVARLIAAAERDAAEVRRK